MGTKPSSASGEPPATTVPKQIGPYKILEVLGEGGMGTVYLAEQSVPVKRRIALKLIKLGMDSKRVVARFEQERQALALMEHDGIARVYDCGTSERGQPYFVMELVKGIPLTDYCDQHRLSLPDRLQLMQQVCAAVTHAHQKSVVHRDLKPGNVLVTEDLGKVQIKVIDFGLAKAMGQKLVEATLFTEAGRVVGTPEYMAPEQADPTNADIDTRADVYSLGVMLYEVLTGQLPFSGRELRLAGLLEMQRVLREVEPQKPSTKLSSVRETATAIAAQRRTSAAALRKALKNDLDWVVLRALEKDRARRYDTANALAMDLQRYLEHEPLVAGPPSAGYRLRKLVRRYRGQFAAASAVVLASLAFGGVAVWQYVRAEGKAQEAIEQKGKAEANATLAQQNEQVATQRAAENARLAREKSELAGSESKAKEEALREKERADGKVREFDQLAGVVLYERALANEKDLYPAWPHKIEAMETWLKDDAGKLLAMQDGIEKTVRDLESRALPLTVEQQEADRRLHPRFAEFEELGQRVASWRYAQAIRGGTAVLVVPELTAEQRALDAEALRAFAWQRVAPPANAGEPEQRTVYGEEALALAFARAALAKAYGTDAEYQVLDTLAWALLANGQDAEAKAQSEEALANAPGNDEEAYRGYQRNLEAAITQAAAMLAAAEQQFVHLTAAVSARQTWRFGTTPAAESAQFLHETLVDLLRKLVSLEAKEKPAVDQRLAWARQIEELSQGHPNARHQWPDVRSAIAANAKYAGQTIELRDRDVTGLVPIGENPVTHLWEFYELRSAWDGKGDPREIVIPEHKPDGSIEVTGDTGIVFVLLPGGTFTMGSQKSAPDQPNYDPGAVDDETPHAVTLLPFFLARHELTQGQWARLWTWDESNREPSREKAGQTNYVGGKITRAHPVETVHWTMCDTVLTRHGLVLPTEAQWEYGCRGSTTTPWIVELKRLNEVANVADATAREKSSGWTYEAWRDGHVVHAPVGSFAANGFGLYDVLGNVWEWCLDWYDDYGTEQAGDGLRVGSGSAYRCCRGGSFGYPAANTRSASRYHSAASFRGNNLGVRPARTLTP